jgi:hypothetical protein
MTFYWRGNVSGQASIIGAFYRHADAKLRGQTLNFVGWSLHKSEGPLPEEIAQRLKKLLVSRIEAAKEQMTGAAEELREYGWWFASRRFEDGWSIDRLLEVLQLVGWVEPDHLVVERLAEMSQTRPFPCVQALRMMVEGDKNGWGVLGWREKAKEVIRAARKSGDFEARKGAEELVNLLESRGHFEFGELRKESTD